MRIPAWGLCIAALGLAACADSPPPRPATLRTAVCRELRAAPLDSAPVETTVIHLPPTTPLLSGFALAGPELHVLDLPEGHVTRLDAQHGSTVGTYGQTGSGPGEFAEAPGKHVLALSASSWIDTWADTVLVFDGERISRFDSTGRFISATNVPVSIEGIATTFRWTAHGPIIDLVPRGSPAEGKRSSGRVTHLIALAAAGQPPLATLSLPPLPSLDGRRSYSGPAEARPRWAVSGACFVLTDGHSNELILGDVGSAARDTVELPLPERFLDADSANEHVGKLLGRTERLPRPALPLRIAQISLSPDGWVWMRPVQPRGLGDRMEAWRYQLRTRRFVMDTVEFFPERFEGDGRRSGARRDSTGQWSVLISGAAGAAGSAGARARLARTGR